MSDSSRPATPPTSRAGAPEILRLVVGDESALEPLDTVLLRLATGPASEPPFKARVLIDGRAMRSRAAFLHTLDLAFETRLLLGEATRVAVVTTFSPQVPNPHGFFELFGAPAGTIAHFWTTDEAERWLGGE